MADREDRATNFSRSFLENLLRTSDDAVRNAANTATFGMADRLVSALPEWLGGEENAQARTAESRYTSPNASHLGRVAGYAAPFGKVAGGIMAIPQVARSAWGPLAAYLTEGGIYSSAHQLGEEGTWDPYRTGKDAMLNAISDIARFGMGRGPEDAFLNYRGITSMDDAGPPSALPVPPQTVNTAAKADPEQYVNREGKTDMRLVLAELLRQAQQR